MDCFAAPEVAEAQHKENMFQADFGYGIEDSKVKQGVVTEQKAHTHTHTRNHKLPFLDQHCTH